MGMFKAFECLKCGHRFEGILDVCGRCGSRAAAQSGISACLESGRPPGYAGGSNKPYSARSYDKCFESNFKAMGITNCQHKDGKPICTFANHVDAQRQSYPGWAGNQPAIRAYGSLAEMSKAMGGVQPAMVSEGRPLEIPNVHAGVQQGAVVGKFPSALRERTVFTHRSRE